MAKQTYKKEKEINFNINKFNGDFIVMFSGGKDSTAALLFVMNYIKNYNKKNRIRVLFADTGIEHDYTYEYINYIEKELNINVEHINNNKFVDICVEKKMFPRPRQRFCTKELKVKAFRTWIHTNYIQQGKETGRDFIVVQGIRAEESARRAAVYAEFNIKTYKVNYKPFSVIYWNPILHWTTADVFEYIEDNGLQQNKVYIKLGLQRASCYPCIMSNLQEIKHIATDSAALKRIVEMEKALFYSRKSNNEDSAYTPFFQDYNKQKYLTEKMLMMDEVTNDEEFFLAVLLYKLTEEFKMELNADLRKLRKIKKAEAEPEVEQMLEFLKESFKNYKENKKAKGAAGETEGAAEGGENGLI